MEKIDSIIEKAPEKMQPMLNSVYNYLSSFVKTEKQHLLLENIISAMILIDRKDFTLHEEEAYFDNAVHIGEGQTISQPSTVARMLLLLELKKGNNVLEVGTGSGWNSSLISYLISPGKIESIDIFPNLVKKAQKNILNLKNSLKPEEKQKIKNILLNVKNIFDFKEKKKYNKIIFTAGIQNEEQKNKIREIAKNLLKENGILIVPMVSGPLIIFRKQKNLILEEKTWEEYVFVPLIDS